MSGMEKPVQVSLPTEIGGSVKFLLGNVNPFRTHTENRADLTIQPTIVHSNQANVLGHNYQYHFPLGILYSGTNIPISGHNIDNRTGMTLQGPIITTISESKSVSNCDIFDSVRRMSDIAYRGLPCHGAENSESENLGAKTFRKY